MFCIHKFHLLIWTNCCLFKGKYKTTCPFLRRMGFVWHNRQLVSLIGIGSTISVLNILFNKYFHFKTEKGLYCRMYNWFIRCYNPQTMIYFKWVFLQVCSTYSTQAYKYVQRHESYIIGFLNDLYLYKSTTKSLMYHIGY